jgi:integrase
MDEVIDRYMDEMSPLKPASHARNQVIAALLKEFFGSYLIEKVKPALVSAYKAKRLQATSRRGGAVAPGTVRKELSLLRRIFNVAVEEWELCRENPVKKVLKTLPADQKRIRYVLPEEATRLAFTLPAWLKPILITACQTGLRRGDLLDLTLKQVDFASGRIVVEKTKNGDPIGITMTPTVQKALRQVIAMRKVASAYVFSDAHGQKLRPDRVTMAFVRACRRAGIEDLRWHDLRHDFATVMLSKRGNLTEVQHAMGHKDPRMTARYAHALPGHLKSAYQAIDGEGTAGIVSRSLHVPEHEDEVIAVTA